MTASKNIEDFENTRKMPVLFIGHGNPMNAILDNEFVQGFKTIASEVQKPKAILCISAHWETNGSKLTAMQNPPSIHDFGGFPQKLYEIQYPAAGSPELAEAIKSMVKSCDLELDYQWGLDHGSWSVLRNMYPEADIPVIQLSLDKTKSPKAHYEMAQELHKLREKGILIIGSGNLVHNLAMVDWPRLNENFAYSWAQEAMTKMTQFILERNHEPLINYKSQGKAFNLAIPTPEHFLPLLYCLALQDDEDEVKIFNNKPIAGSLDMSSVKIG